MPAARINLCFVCDELILLAKRLHLPHRSAFGLRRQRSFDLGRERTKRDFFLDFLKGSVRIELNVFRVTVDDQLCLIDQVSILRVRRYRLDRSSLDLLLKSFLNCRGEFGTADEFSAAKAKDETESVVARIVTVAIFIELLYEPFQKGS